VPQWEYKVAPSNPDPQSILDECERAERA
jgi:hypothetical protein